MAGQNLPTKQVLTFSEAIQKNNKAITENSKAFGILQKGLGQINKSLHTTIGGIKSSTAGILGLSLGIRGLIRESFSLGQQVTGWHNALNLVSDSAGSTTAAVNLMTKAWGKSLGSIGEIQSAMGALANQGMRVSAEMENLTIFITNISRASGLSQDALAKITGGMTSYWNVSVTGSRQMVSAVLAAGKAFGSTRDQMQEMIGVISESVERIGPLFKDGERSALALTKGISMVQGALTKMGVTAKTASEFMGKLLDPERFAETNTLMRMLGVTFEEQMRMYESASGKELFFDKLLQNLPRLSRQIQAIQNPLARLQFAKSLGLPPEIASKLASASASQMRGIIEEYKAQAEGEKAAAEKQRLAAANQARFEESLMFFKMKILMPLMQWVMGPGYQLLWKIRTLLVPVIQWFMRGLTNVLTIITDSLNPVIDAFSSGNFGDTLIDSFDSFITRAREGFDELWNNNLQPFIKNKLLPFITNTLLPFVKHVGKKIAGVVWDFLKENKLIAMAIIGVPLTKFLFGFGATLVRLIAMQRMMSAIQTATMATQAAAGVPGAVMPSLVAGGAGAGMMARMRAGGERVAGGVRRVSGAVGRGWGRLGRGGRAGVIIGGAALAGAGLYSAFGGGGRATEEQEPQEQPEMGMGGRISGAAGMASMGLAAGRGASRIGTRIAGRGAAQGAKAIPGLGWVLAAIMAIGDFTEGANQVGGELNKITGRTKQLTQEQKSRLLELRRLEMEGAIKGPQISELVNLRALEAEAGFSTMAEKIIGGTLNAITLGFMEPATLAKATLAVTNFFSSALTQAEKARLSGMERGGAPTAATVSTAAKANEYNELKTKQMSGIEKSWRSIEWGQIFGGSTGNIIANVLTGGISGLMLEGINQSFNVAEQFQATRLTDVERTTLETNQRILNGGIEAERRLGTARIKEIREQTKRLLIKQAESSMTLEQSMSGMIGRIVNIFTDMPDAGARISAWWNGFKAAFWNFIDGFGDMASNAALRVRAMGMRGNTEENYTRLVNQRAAASPGSRLNIQQQRFVDLSSEELEAMIASGGSSYVRQMEQVGTGLTGTAGAAMDAKLTQARRLLTARAIQTEAEARQQRQQQQTQHRQTLGALGGIGAGINEVAGNTRPRTSGQDFLTAFIGGGGLMGLARGSSV